MSLSYVKGVSLFAGFQRMHGMTAGAELTMLVMLVLSFLRSYSLLPARSSAAIRSAPSSCDRERTPSFW
jgi:hypothetical protein